jgi:ATP synthase protein I
MKSPAANHDKLRQTVRKRVGRIKKAVAERPTVFAQTIYLGTLGLVFILPVIAGAYLGVWLDARLQGYSVSWTVTMILLGVFVGSVNVYLLVKE